MINKKPVDKFTGQGRAVLTEAQTEINVTTFIAHRSLGLIILASVSKISNPKIESYQCVPHIVITKSQFFDQLL